MHERIHMSWKRLYREEEGGGEHNNEKAQRSEKQKLKSVSVSKVLMKGKKIGFRLLKVNNSGKKSLLSDECEES